MKPGWLVVVAAVAVASGAGCACKGSSPGGTGPGTGGGTGRVDAPCEGQLAHVRALYQEAAGPVEDGGPAGTEVADNVAMVMKECAVEPARVAPCLAAAQTARILERRCLPALDDEGSEGRIFTDR